SSAVVPCYLDASISISLAKCQMLGLPIAVVQGFDNAFVQGFCSQLRSSSSTGVIQSNAFVQGLFKSNAHVLLLYDRLVLVYMLQHAMKLENN
ncbi:hypothetical protein U1Q18_020287, partial [Sarracenia purpurea var. burkii]